MPSLYFLFSQKDKGWYIGQTTLPLADRFKRHRDGHVRSTRHRRPLLLAYFEQWTTRQSAMQREWHLKHPKGYQEKLSIIGDLLQNKDRWPLEGPFMPYNDERHGERSSVG